MAREPKKSRKSSTRSDRPELVVRALWAHKQGNTESQWEDGFAVDVQSGVLAVADGASDGVFTKVWVELLLKSFIAAPLALDDMQVVEPWLFERRQKWFATIDYPNLRWSLRKRVDTSCAAATFLAFRLDEPEASPKSKEPAAPHKPSGWTAWAVGDVCLFHVRDNRLITTFPIERSSEFSYTPSVYQSKALLPTPKAQVLKGELRPGDLLLFATDALANQMMVTTESGDDAPDWDRLLAVDQDAWRQEIEFLRERGEMVNDDCTLLIVRQVPADSEVAVASEPGAAELHVDPSRPENPAPPGGTRP
jgi:hypothetical protein